jgi:hypothetical protein
MLDAETISDQQTGMAEQELLMAERHAALREAAAPSSSVLTMTPLGSRR